jgi:hypothetical protein
LKVRATSAVSRPAWILPYKEFEVNNGFMYVYSKVSRGVSEQGMFNAATTVGPGDLVVFSHATIPIKRGE